VEINAIYNDNTIKAAKDAGYVMGFILGGKVAQKMMEFILYIGYV